MTQAAAPRRNSRTLKNRPRPSDVIRRASDHQVTAARLRLLAAELEKQGADSDLIEDINESAAAIEADHRSKSVSFVYVRSSEGVTAARAVSPEAAAEILLLMEG